MDLLILLIALVIILFGAELFTNGIEWFGRSLEPRRGGRRFGPGGRRDGAPRDAHPDHRDRVRHGRGVGRGRRRGHPRRPVHALDAGDVRDRRRRSSCSVAGAPPARTCASNAASSPTTCATSPSPTRIAIGVGVPPRPACLPLARRDRADRDLRVVRARATSRRRPRTTRRNSPAALPPDGLGGASRRPASSRVSGSSTCRCWSPSG